MRLLVLIISILFFGVINLTAQTTLTKEEIIDSWRNTEAGVSLVKYLSNITPSQKSNSRINSIVDSLNVVGIDFFIIYAVSYPGYISIGKNNCFENSYPCCCYLLWGNKEEMNIKFIKGKCEFDTIMIDTTDILSFCYNFYNIIEKEKVMPVIFSVQKNYNNQIVYTIESISHEPQYSLCIKSGDNLKVLEFTENDVENKSSLFYEHNSNLKSIKLWAMIKELVQNSFK